MSGKNKSFSGGALLVALGLTIFTAPTKASADSKDCFGNALIAAAFGVADGIFPGILGFGAVYSICVSDGGNPFFTGIDPSFFSNINPNYSMTAMSTISFPTGVTSPTFTLGPSDLSNLDRGVNVGDLEIGADIAVSLASVDFSDIGAEAVDDAECIGIPFGG